MQKHRMINLKFAGNGKRSGVIDMHGFEGPAKNNLFDGGEYVKRGEITGAYTLPIPPSGLCSVVDTQHNRLRLRILTQPSKRWDYKDVYIEKENRWEQQRAQIDVPPPFQVLSPDIDISKDLPVEARKYSAEEVAKLKDRIAELEKGQGAPPELPPDPGAQPEVQPERKTENSEGQNISGSEGQGSPVPQPLDQGGLPMEEEGPPEEEKRETAKERNARVFAHKANALPSKGMAEHPPNPD
jgi:hypothetical protein